jgi:hypothetical protein
MLTHGANGGHSPKLIRGSVALLERIAGRHSSRHPLVVQQCGHGRQPHGSGEAGGRRSHAAPVLGPTIIWLIKAKGELTTSAAGQSTRSLQAAQVIDDDSSTTTRKLPASWISRAH